MTHEPFPTNPVINPTTATPPPNPTNPNPLTEQKADNAQVSPMPEKTNPILSPVELGQIAVIVAAFVAVGWFMRRAWYHSRIVVPASLAIAAMGAWWFVERTFG